MTHSAAHSIREDAPSGRGMLAVGASTLAIAIALFAVYCAYCVYPAVVHV